MINIYYNYKLHIYYYLCIHHVFQFFLTVLHELYLIEGYVIRVENIYICDICITKKLSRIFIYLYSEK